MYFIFITILPVRMSFGNEILQVYIRGCSFFRPILGIKATSKMWMGLCAALLRTPGAQDEWSVLVEDCRTNGRFYLCNCSTGSTGNMCVDLVCRQEISGWKRVKEWNP